MFMYILICNDTMNYNNIQRKYKEALIALHCFRYQYFIYSKYKKLKYGTKHFTM